jgi:hypothetical protein
LSGTRPLGLAHAAHDHLARLEARARELRLDAVEVEVALVVAGVAELAPRGARAGGPARADAGADRLRGEDVDRAQRVRVVAHELARAVAHRGERRTVSTFAEVPPLVQPAVRRVLFAAS